MSRRLQLALLLLLAFAPVGVTAVAGVSTASEYELKAAYILRFLPFIQFPDAALPNDAREFTIGILGDDPFGGALERTFAGQSIQGRKAVVRQIASAEEVKSVQVLFIGKDLDKQAESLIHRFEKGPLLLVGESSQFCRAGGTLTLLILDNKLRFSINQESARKAGLVVSAKILSLAVPCAEERR